uniref:Uncharacterized protein n=1 Tax=Mycena chlorophos TaxID=658473 RepID=A0ABQ0LE04_MYCCL|nr:predicted protein [Mycena chlorophos]
MPKKVDDGYESSTGLRDVPTYRDFLNNRPMKKTISISTCVRALNRQGRAIARIMYAHDANVWTCRAIARIFRVSEQTIARCILPAKYSVRYPGDVVADDVRHAGSKFAKHFPPFVPPLEDDWDDESDAHSRPRVVEKRINVCLEGFPRCVANAFPDPETRTFLVTDVSRGSKRKKRAVPVTQRPEKGRSDKERTNRRTAQKPRFYPRSRKQLGRQPHKAESVDVMVLCETESDEDSEADSEASVARVLLPSLIQHHPSLPSNTLPDSTLSQPLPMPNEGHELTTFLCRILPASMAEALTTPAHLALYAHQGLDAQTFDALAQWPERELAEALQRLLLKTREADGATSTPESEFGLDLFEVLSLQDSLAALRREPSASPRPLQWETMAGFLSNIRGLDLSAHGELFRAHGFTLERLRLLSGAANMPKILSRGLMRGQWLVGSAQGVGLSAVEVIALEFALQQT